ncbi:MAG: peptidoglycan D,D-transpeptidase FtsI family protein [Alphaproteobacteria bacterium]
MLYRKNTSSSHIGTKSRAMPLIDFLEEKNLLDDYNLPQDFKSSHHPRQKYLQKIKRRMITAIVVLAMIFLVPAYHLSHLAMNHSWQTFTAIDKTIHHSQTFDAMLPRGKIYDREGFLLAGNLPTISLIAKPRNIINPRDTARKLSSLLPYLQRTTLLKQFQDKKHHRIVLAQNLDPVIKESILALGEPGLQFSQGNKRFYTSHRIGAVTMGFVNRNHQGMMGLERFFDKELSAGKDITLSLDSRVQNFLDEELAKAKRQHAASAAGGLVMDIKNGEVLGLSSLPSFNPNNRTHLNIDHTFNMITGGSYELGSVMKIITLAQWLEQQQKYATDGPESWRRKLWNVTAPLEIDGYKINDHHPIDRPITSDEVFIYSSNIGAALLNNDADAKNKMAQKDFLRSLHLLSKMDFEFSASEMARPIIPKTWGRLEANTISFGHGLSLPPIQFAAAIATLVGDGVWRAPTLRLTDIDDAKHQGLSILQRMMRFMVPMAWQEKLPSGLFHHHKTADKKTIASIVAKDKTLVVSQTTREELRRLLRLNVLYGSGQRINQTGAVGYEIGGKTGTAEKPSRGRYDKDKNLTSFVAVFPISNPRYLAFLLLDNTQKGDLASATLAPTVGQLVAKIAPLLAMVPSRDLEKTRDNQLKEISYFAPLH